MGGRAASSGPPRLVASSQLPAGARMASPVDALSEAGERVPWMKSRPAACGDWRRLILPPDARVRRKQGRFSRAR